MPFALTVAWTQNWFCTLSKIYPKVIEEYAEYLFLIDLKQYSTQLEATKPNEFMIVFPYQFYWEVQTKNSNILCYFQWVQQTCSFLEKSMLYVRFNSSIPVQSDDKLQLKILWIYNPFIANNDQKAYFLYSLNETNFSTWSRKTLIRWVSQLIEGINYQTDTQFGNIRILNNYTLYTTSVQDSKTDNADWVSVRWVESLNPREAPELTNVAYQTLHQFAFTLDIANNLVSNLDNFKVSNSPTLIITFPVEYNISWFTINPTVKIEWVSLDPNNLSVMVSDKTSLTVKSASIIWNQLTISFNQE